MSTTTFNHSEDYLDTLKNMNALYVFWNDLYFGGELDIPVITVRQDLNGRAYGWFVPHKVWVAKDGCDGSVEINMCSQWLDRPIDEIAGTMLHEMCHQYAYTKPIKDTSRYGYYHNRQFKDIAEKHGLKVEYMGRYHGWCKTELTEASINSLARFVQKGRILYDLRDRHDPSWFGSADKEGAIRQRKPSSTRKYTCPKCGMSVRATKDVFVLCGDCRVALVSEKHNIVIDPSQDKSWVSIAAGVKQ